MPAIVAINRQERDRENSCSSKVPQDSFLGAVLFLFL